MEGRDCIDLRETYGDRFKVESERAVPSERTEFRSEEAPWLMVIPCQLGQIYPYGGSLLSAHTDHRCSRNRLMALDCCEIYQLGDTEVTVNFNVRDFDRVAELLKPKKRRRLSPEHRQKLVRASIPHRFRPAPAG